ncbi:hypothetical protein PRIPAC_82940 [Pristionchus pacificus]|uniref:Uncharacterized protein n=1 Tax=Pristionchus pacificus TaxID=54126 RepID=A0A2A6CQ02_PRIPA|nr:hypothetical protein PRIPAC_82940 [Pristionchus pacificus]|eukprot:PDM80219.1 hypothetical protein PRIPAC_32798 [Pristionchus pacificus]
MSSFKFNDNTNEWENENECISHTPQMQKFKQQYSVESFDHSETTQEATQEISWSSRGKTLVQKFVHKII